MYIIKYIKFSCKIQPCDPELLLLTVAKSLCSSADYILIKAFRREMLHRVALVRTNVSEERIASIIRVKRIRELGTTLVILRSTIPLLVTSNVDPCSLIVSTLVMLAIYSFETLAITRDTGCNIPVDGILHGHCCENPKSYNILIRYAKDDIKVNYVNLVANSKGKHLE
jgi:hypothetical protein